MKKYLVIILSAIAIGGGIAYHIFNIKVVKEDDTYSLVKAFQVGAFTNHDNALRVALRNNGIVVDDNDIYRVYVAILEDDLAIEKLSNYYQEIGLNYYLKEISVSNEFYNTLESSEELLVKSSSDTYNAINMSILSKYEEML